MALLVQTYLVHNVSPKSNLGEEDCGRMRSNESTFWLMGELNRQKKQNKTCIQCQDNESMWNRFCDLKHSVVCKSNSVLEAIIKREPGKCELSASGKCVWRKETPTRCGLINSLETAGIIMPFQVYKSLLEYQWQLAVETLSTLLTIYLRSSHCLPLWTQF